MRCECRGGRDLRMPSTLRGGWSNVSVGLWCRKFPIIPTRWTQSTKCLRALSLCRNPMKSQIITPVFLLSILEIIKNVHFQLWKPGKYTTSVMLSVLNVFFVIYLLSRIIFQKKKLVVFFSSFGSYLLISFEVKRKKCFTLPPDRVFYHTEFCFTFE